MRKLVSIAFVLCLLLVAMPAFAQSPRPITGLFGAPSSGAMKATVQPDFNVLFSGLPLNLSGDTLYRSRAGTFDAAAGIDLATYKNMVFMRAEASQSTTGSTFAGMGFTVNIPSLINLLAGASWTASYINPSIGIVPGYDFGRKKYDTGILLSIVQVTF